MSWIDKLLPPQIQHTDPVNRKSVPEGLWVKCPDCATVLYSTDLEANLSVCPKCSHHMRIGARQRLDSLLDEKGRYEIGADIYPIDPLKFKDSKKYPDRIKEANDASGESEA
jgi:acetyl-CoA carboxylase carboxyl transferase subunit beta